MEQRFAHLVPAPTPRELAVHDAHYYRNQAALCLETAKLLSDKRAAKKLRSDAVRFFSLAVELEAKQEGKQEAAPRTGSPRLDPA